MVKVKEDIPWLDQNCIGSKLRHQNGNTTTVHVPRITRNMYEVICVVVSNVVRGVGVVCCVYTT